MTQTSSKKDFTAIKDSEGIELSDQFLSLRKTKMQGESELDKQKDENFDFRDLFFFGNEDAEEILDQFLKEGKDDIQAQINPNAYNKKKPRRGKKEYNVVYVSKEEKSQIYFEDIQAFHHNDIYGLSRRNFEEKVSEYLNQTKYNQFYSTLNAFSTGKLAVDHVVTEFMAIFGEKTVSTLK